MNKRAYDILNSHIVVSTPQMIVNLMESVSKDRHIYITDFTLYVLDECHHCMSKHPYEIMMRKVRNFIDDPKNPKRKHPQVVGLTASLGTNQGNTTEQVEQHIYSKI
jgi:ATP-dependent RNA helicase DHX58